jgi:3-phenylpropionate/cinnamic acid dioxygenase small subunit
VSATETAEIAGTLQGTKVLPNDPLYGEVLDFLYTESELLDKDRLTEWLEMLGDDLSYRMPVRVTLERGDGPGFSESTYFDDDKMLLGMRVTRIVTSQNAHAEMPATRSRRFVTNVRVETLGDDVLARSSVLLLRSRWDNKWFEFLSARRNDVLRRVDGQLKLASREILIDQAVVESPNLSVFL